jgi:hypothetical protein
MKTLSCVAIMLVALIIGLHTFTPGNPLISGCILVFGVLFIVIGVVALVSALIG